MTTIVWVVLLGVGVWSLVCFALEYRANRKRLGFAFQVEAMAQDLRARSESQRCRCQWCMAEVVYARLCPDADAMSVLADLSLRTNRRARA